MTSDGWQEFIPERATSRPAIPLAIIGRGPGMRLSGPAVELLNDTAYVVFSFDRSGRRVGIQRSDSSIRHAFPLKRYKAATMSTISAESFYKWALIRFDERREYLVERINDHTLMIQLEDGGPPGEFEEFTLKGQAAVHQIPNVSISRNGHLSLNEPAARLIGAPDRVVMLYNVERRLIGLRPGQNELHARALRRAGSQRTWAIAGEGFLKQFGIPHEVGRSFEPRIADGVLVVDLSQPKPPYRGKRERSDDNG